MENGWQGRREVRERVSSSSTRRAAADMRLSSSVLSLPSPASLHPLITLKCNLPLSPSITLKAEALMVAKPADLDDEATTMRRRRSCGLQLVFFSCFLLLFLGCCSSSDSSSSSSSSC